ncbi:lactonase family protein [Spirosoma areae]
MKRTLLSLFLSVALFSCTDHRDPTGRADILYVQTNNFQANQNAVLAYRNNGSGNLEPLAGSPFLTNGSGVGNPEQLLGPLDSDYEVRVSSDGQYLLAVNSGSNTIAVFSIKATGALEHVAGSPFPSNGQTPVGIDVSGNFVFVLNKSQDPLHPTPQLPNYATFTIDAAGKLTPVAGAKVETTAGTSPSNVLVSRDGKFMFGTDFLGFMLMPPVGTLRSFTINGTGGLTAVAGTPYVVPGMDGAALGLWQHPSGSVLYVGNPLQGKVGVYAINATTGALSLQTSVPAGKAACWIRTNKAGDHMYVLNSGDNTVQVYNTSNPLAPASMQTLELKNSGPTYPGPGGAPFKTSQPFSLVFSSSETILYVVNQHTNKDFSIGNYNYLHTLKIAADGRVTEDADPLQLPVPNTVRPKGSVIINR